MNICILSRAIPTHRVGGMEKHTWALAQGLQRQGHGVIILTAGHPDDRMSEEIEGVTVRYLKGTTPDDYRTFRKAAARELAGWRDIDLVHSQSIAASSYLSCPLRKPVVCTIHGTFLSESTLSPVYLRNQNYLRRGAIFLKHLDLLVKHYTLFKTAIEQADGLIAGSHYTEEQLTRLSARVKDKISVIYHGINLEAFQVLDKTWARDQVESQMGVRLNSLVVLTVSRLDKTKGIQVAIKAFETLSRWLGARSGDVTLAVVGEGSYRRNLQRLADRLNLRNIVFLGEITEDLLPIVYNAADIFLDPELVEPAFGLVVAEAMACGIPVIASRSGAIPEIVDDNVGRLFTPGDFRSLARELSELLQDDEKRAKMGAQAAQKARAHFDERRMVEQTSAFYEWVISRAKEGIR